MTHACAKLGFDRSKHVCDERATLWLSLKRLVLAKFDPYTQCISLQRGGTCRRYTFAAALAHSPTPPFVHPSATRKRSLVHSGLP